MANLQREGGKDMVACLKRVMPKIMSHEIVRDYTRTGRGKGDKRSLEELKNVKKLIVGELLKVIMQWFFSFRYKVS